METDNKLGDEDPEESFPTEGIDDKMIDDAVESSDNETSHGLNSVYSRGGISSVTGGPFPHTPVHSPSNNSEDDSMEEVTTSLEQKLKSGAAQPPASTLDPKMAQQRTDGTKSSNPKQE